MLRAGDIKHGSIVRYQNKIYYVFRVSYAEDRPEFIEYHAWKITRETHKKEFYLDIVKGEYEDYQKSDQAFRRSQFKKVLREIILVDPEAAEAAYIDCLNTLYTQALARTLCIEEIVARETVHVNRFKEYLQDVLVDISRDLYTCAAKGHNCYTMRFRCTQDFLTQYGKFPILFGYPNGDGVKRDTFDAYLTYIFFKVFPWKEDTDTDSDTDRMGALLVSHLKTIYSGLHIEWRTQQQLLPDIVISWSAPAVNVLL
jgi:hypothetical protein